MEKLQLTVHNSDGGMNGVAPGLEVPASLSDHETYALSQLSEPSHETGVGTIGKLDWSGDLHLLHKDNAILKAQRRSSNWARELRHILDGVAKMTSGTALKDQTLQLAEAQKSVGAEKISSVAGAVHEVAQVLEGEIPQAATYVHDAANQIEHAAAQLKDRSLDELLSGVGGFARRHPLTFFGGALLAGLVVSRFLKSSVTTKNM